MSNQGRGGHRDWHQIRSIQRDKRVWVTKGMLVIVVMADHERLDLRNQDGTWGKKSKARDGQVMVMGA